MPMFKNLVKQLSLYFTQRLTSKTNTLQELTLHNNYKYKHINYG